MSRVHSIKDVAKIPALDRSPDAEIPANSTGIAGSAPRILLLCGSLHPYSRSQVAVEEAARLLAHFGAEARVFDASDLPLPDRYSNDSPAVLELRALSRWSKGQVWCNAEHRGAISSLMKAQLDHLRPSNGDAPCSGRALAVMQVFNEAQPFKAVNTLRVLGRKLGMSVLPSEVRLDLSAAAVDEDRRMKPSTGYQQIADLMKRLVDLTLSLELSTGAPPLSVGRVRKAAAKAASTGAERLSP